MAKLLKIFLRIGSKNEKNGLLQHISYILQLTEKTLYVITPEIFYRIRIFFIEFWLRYKKSKKGPPLIAKNFSYMDLVEIAIFLSFLYIFFNI